jgi:hypothetical protein
MGERVGKLGVVGDAVVGVVGFELVFLLECGSGRDQFTGPPDEIWTDAREIGTASEGSGDERTSAENGWCATGSGGSASELGEEGEGHELDVTRRETVAVEDEDEAVVTRVRSGELTQYAELKE